MNERNYYALTYFALATVAKAGSAGVPSGHLYAQLMNRCSLDEFQAVINNLRTSDMITEASHVLRITEKGKPLGLKLSEAISQVA